MAENESHSADSAEESKRIRRQLLFKGGVAALAVAVLVGALVMVEGPHQEEPAPTARTMTPIGVVTSDTALPSLAEAATQALRNSTEAAELQSVVMAEQQATASAAAAAPVVREESAEPVAPVASSAPQASGKGRQEAGGRLVLEQSPPKGARTVAPSVATSKSSSASSSASVAAKVVPLTLPLKPPVFVANAPQVPSSLSATSSPNGFFVQVGVFSNSDNAEVLRAKLKAAGIPTQVETRVQVGPFKSREEAAAAQAKLKALGLDGGMVVPGKH